jgi:transposase
MNPSPSELVSYMNRNYPGGKYHSVYEAGFSGYWIHRELIKLGFENSITNAADVPTTNKEKDRKSDPIDSAKLSRELENQSLTGIYIINQEQEGLRSLYRLYSQYTKRNTQIKNRIKSLLNFTGIKIPERFEDSYWSKNYINMLRQINIAEDTVRIVLNDHIDELEHTRQKRLTLLRNIRIICKNISTIQYLRTVPGVGLITAFVLYVELVDIKRFKSLDKIQSYIGFVPSTSSSGEKEQVKGITNRHNKFLRNIIIESAWVAVRMDPALTSAYNQLTKRLTKQRAIVRIAKKLVNRIRWVWLHQQEYVPGLVECL